MARPTDQHWTILHLTGGALLGGVTRHICDLSRQLIGRGHRTLAAGAPGPWRNLFSDEGIDWRELPLSGGPLALWTSAGAIARIVRQEQVDLIHCHYRRPVLAARLAARRGAAGIPIVYTLHLAPIPIGGVWRWLTDFGDLVLAPSEFARQWITTAGRVARDRVVLVPHGLSPRKWTRPDPAARRAARQHLGLSSSQPVGAFVGRFEAPKNEGWVLDVAAECRRRGIDATVLLCGDGPNAERVRRRIDDEELGPHVRLLGYVDPHDAYCAADLLLLPSAVEGFAYVAAEAAACGVAVLRTRTAGWHETVRDGVTGRVVEIDHDQFVGAAVDMLADRSRLAQMGAAGADLVRAELTLDRQVDRTIEFYRRALAGSPRQRRAGA